MHKTIRALEQIAKVHCYVDEEHKIKMEMWLSLWDRISKSNIRRDQ